MGFHLTEFTYELGGAHAGEKAVFKAGDVLKVLSEGSAFDHAVVLGFQEDGECKLSRPYAYANGTGTTCANVLLGAETYTMTANNMKHLATCDARVDTGRVT